MKGTKVLAAVFHHLACQQQAWPGVLRSDLDVPVGLVVFEADVVARPVLFDQGVFEEQGLFFAGGDQDLNVCKLSKKEGDLHPAIAAARILTHSRAQAFGFADVDDLATFSLEEIHAWAGRQG